VQLPGVYALPQDSRVKDAIEAAGGMTAETDRDAVNLAARLKDGDKLIVPILGAEQTVLSSPPPDTQPAQRTNSLDAEIPGEIININTSTADELTVLPGIGPSLAEKIVTYREGHGQFKAIEDIMDVPGIGPAKFDQMKDLIAVE